MAHLANCPQCDHELLVPDGVAAGSLARCPGCQALFQIKDGRARELPTVEVITSATEPSADEDQTRPTVANDLEFGELPAILDSNELTADDSLESQPAGAGGGNSVDDSETAHLHIAEVSEPLDFDAPSDKAPPKESPEAAAERIDAWFRSAKTLPDVPAIKAGDVDYHTERESLFGPTASDANNATIEIGSGGIQELSDDFELDEPHESPPAAAAWDDTQHMEQLLAGVPDHPQDEQIRVEAQGAELEDGGHGADAADWAGGMSVTANVPDVHEAAKAGRSTAKRFPGPDLSTPFTTCRASSA
jgi:hypothetical protein